MTPTAEQIVQRIRDRVEEDFMAFETGEYIQCLPFELASEFLPPTVVASEWVPREHSRETVLKIMGTYMPYAWEKANERRNISANRSIMHYIAWTWLVGDTELSEWIDQQYDANFVFYGKDILVRICQHYGFEWEPLDNGERTNA